MWGGKLTREGFRKAMTMEIAAIKGQNTLGSGRVAITQAASVGLQPARVNGATITAKIHARIGMIEYLSIILLDGAIGPA
ncbi:MAG TPA: hypothetical protein VH684_16790 [Xanthobacteraceae bacterium]|jgi:hypothetical protein